MINDRRQLADVYQQTIDIVLEGHYTSENGEEVKLPDNTKMLKGSRFYTLKSATYRVSWEFTCKTTKILLLYKFLGHNRNVVNTKFPYPIKRLEVIRRFNKKSIAFNQSLS